MLHQAYICPGPRSDEDAGDEKESEEEEEDEKEEGKRVDGAPRRANHGARGCRLKQQLKKEEEEGEEEQESDDAEERESSTSHEKGIDLVTDTESERGDGPRVERLWQNTRACVAGCRAMGNAFRKETGRRCVKECALKGPRKAQRGSAHGR